MDINETNESINSSASNDNSDKPTAFEEVISNEEVRTENLNCVYHIEDLTRLVRSCSVNTPELSEKETKQHNIIAKSLSVPEKHNEEYNNLEEILNNRDTITPDSPKLNSDQTDEKKSENENIHPVFDEHKSTPELTVEKIEDNVIDHEEEYVQSSEWRDKPMHLFVLTEAGKPVFSRHGSEDKLSTLMGVLLALVSCVQDRNDMIRHIIAGKSVFVFYIKPPLILVAISSSKSCYQYAKVNLQYMYNAVLSVLTLGQLEKIYKTQKNFDLRRLLTGTDKLFDYLCTSMDYNPQFLLHAVKCLRVPSNIRDVAGQALQQAKMDNLAFAILVAYEQVVNICRLKEHVLYPSDLHLILNLINSSTAFHTGESWTPICLPNFNPKGYLHAHISYLDEDYKVCLLLLSADCDAFFALSESKKKVVARLNRQNCLQVLINSSSHASYSMQQVGVPDILHFIYKSKNSSQFTSPSVSVPYNTEEGKAKLFHLYQSTHGLIHNQATPRKLIYLITQCETILGWVTSGFELYAIFGPLVTKHSAISAVNRLLRWIKKENDDLFISQPAFF